MYLYALSYLILFIMESQGDAVVIFGLHRFINVLAVSLSDNFEEILQMLPVLALFMHSLF